VAQTFGGGTSILCHSPLNEEIRRVVSTGEEKRNYGGVLKGRVTKTFRKGTFLIFYRRGVGRANIAVKKKLGRKEGAGKEKEQLSPQIKKRPNTGKAGTKRTSKERAVRKRGGTIIGKGGDGYA